MQPRFDIRVSAAGSVGDTGSTLLVVAVVVGLLLLGIALVTAAVWVIRSTRVDPAALTPLEEMGTRSWRSADETERLLLLEQARAETEPTVRSETRIVEVEEPPQDAEALAGD